jgi:uncharacterized membrane protein YfcA
MSMVALLAGLGLGLVFALLGAGGGILAVPLLMLLFAFAPQDAMGASLAIVFVAAVTAALGHARKRNVEWRTVLSLGPAMMLGAVAGAKLNRLLPPQLTTVAFIVVLLGATVSLFIPKREDPRRVATGALLAAGLALGVLTGVLGVGGGFLLVPALVGLAQLPLRRAVGTSAALIATSSIAGAVTVLLDKPDLVLQALPVAAGAFVGAIIGTPLGGRLPEKAVRVGFAVLSVAVAVGMAVKTFAP